MKGALLTIPHRRTAILGLQFCIWSCDRPEASLDIDDSGAPQVACADEASWSDSITQVAAIPLDTESPHLVDGVITDSGVLLLAGGDIDFEAGVWTFELSDVSTPQLIGSDGSQQVMSVCWGAGHGWALQMDGTLGRVSLDQDGAPTLAEVQRLDSAVGRMDCDGDVVAWGHGALGGGWVWDATASQAPREIPGDVRDVALEGDSRLWALGSDRLIAYDFERSSETLVETGSLSLSGSCTDLAMGEAWLVASCGSAGIHLIDRGDGDPTLLGGWNGAASARAAAVSGDRVWVAGWTELLWLDASDPTAPVWLGSEPAESAISAVVSGGADEAFVVDWKHPFVVTGSAQSAPEVRSRDFYAVAGEAVVLSNEGTEDLCLDSPSVGELSSAWLAPGETALWKIPDAVQAGSTVSVKTNDPDELELSLEVGYAEGLSVGDLAPDFTESDQAGGIWQLSELQGQVVFLGMLDGW